MTSEANGGKTMTLAKTTSSWAPAWRIANAAFLFSAGVAFAAGALLGYRRQRGA